MKHLHRFILYLPILSLSLGSCNPSEEEFGSQFGHQINNTQMESTQVQSFAWDSTTSPQFSQDQFYKSAFLRKALALGAAAPQLPSGLEWGDFLGLWITDRFELNPPLEDPEMAAQFETMLGSFSISFYSDFTSTIRINNLTQGEQGYWEFRDGKIWVRENIDGEEEFCLEFQEDATLKLSPLKQNPDQALLFWLKRDPVNDDPPSDVELNIENAH